MRKPTGFFYTWVIPLAWGAVAVLGTFFRAAEDLTTAVGLLPGLLLEVAMRRPFIGNLDWASGNVPRLLLLGLGVMLIFGMAADWLHARRGLWLRCVGWFTLSGVAFLALMFVKAGLQESSFERAVSHLGFDRAATPLAWALCCLDAGLYLGTLVAIGAAMIWPARGRE